MLFCVRENVFQLECGVWSVECGGFWFLVTLSPPSGRVLAGVRETR